MTPMRRLAAGLVVALAGALLPPVARPEQAPSPIVERTVKLTGRTIRLTLFDNRVGVVSVRQGSEQVLLRRQTLEPDEFAGYLAALGRDADELTRDGRRDRGRAADGNAVITLYLGKGAPNSFRYSSLAVLDLVTSRLVATLDDLESRLMWGPEQAPELATWVPRRGDRVELRTGVRATVREAREDGTLVLEHDETGIEEIVPPEARKEVIAHVVERKR